MQRGATLRVHGRDAGRIEGTRDELRAVSSGAEVRGYRADLASLAEVRRLAEAVAAEHSALDALINSAGIGGPDAYPGRCESPDGFELRFAVNYLSGFLLTRLLLPYIKGRIVNVSSLGQQAIDFADVMLTRGYSGRRAYCQSKLAQILFTFDLAEELRETGVTVNALHPATYMDTNMVRADGATPISSVDEGADAILNLIVAPNLEGETGLFFNGLRRSRADGQAYDAQARRKLRELSFDLTGLKDAAR